MTEECDSPVMDEVAEPDRTRTTLPLEPCELQKGVS